MKIQNRQQFLVVLTAIVVGLYASDLVVFEPLGKWWSSRSQRISELRKQVTEGKLLLQREESIRSRWEGMRTNTLPTVGSLAEQEVFKAVDNWSRDSGVEITDIMPQWKNDSDDYLTLNCRVEANGNLGALGRFLYEIEKSPLALKFDTVQLNARDNAGQQLTLGLQISGLVLASNSK
jgi:Tfp pilus assembly protein PilO